MVHTSNMAVRETSPMEESKASVFSYLITEDYELLTKWKIQHFLNVDTFKDKLTASSIILFY
jgi:hypothetical protein